MVVDGLTIVLLRTIQVVQKAMQLGYLVRGGISVGNVWHEDQNIFGSGYIEAYQTEQKAIHPQGMLSKVAAQIVRDSDVARTLCVENDGASIVDVLHSAYLRENEAGTPQEQYFQIIRIHINTNLERMPLGSPERAKWEWMAGFFNEALTRHGINTLPFASLPLPERE
jgi:hypothetical protein